MKTTSLCLLAVLGALACSAPDHGQGADGRADAVAEAALPHVRYYVIADT